MNVANPRLVTSAGVFVTFNTFFRLRYTRMGRSVESDIPSFIVLGLTNGVLALFVQLLTKRGIFSLPDQRIMLFLLLLTLIVTVYDRWRPVSEIRFPARKRRRRSAKGR